MKSEWGRGGGRREKILGGRTSLCKAYRNKTMQCRLEQRGPKGDESGEIMGEERVDHKGPFVLGI